MNILDRKIRCKKLIPSERIYWGKFPYKLVMDAPSGTWYGDTDDLYRTVSFMKEIHHVASHIKGEIRRRYARYTGVYTMYLSNLDDVKTICNLKDVVSVHGPIDKDHVKLLHSDTDISIGKKKFFGEYTHRYSLWYTFMDRRNFGFDHSINQEIKDYVVDQCGTDVVRVRDSYYTTTLYVNAENFEPILPFLKITFPGLRMQKTQRYVWGSQ